MHAGKPAQLRDLGYDEIWLQNWLAADPARLGLGEVQIVAQELSAPRGGSQGLVPGGPDVRGGRGGLGADRVDGMIVAG
jgi:hypothetical protein